MAVIEKLKKIGQKVFDIYFGIGVVAMALLAVLVIFTVIARYFFSMSWKSLSEFNVVLFAFTTFWGMGINIIKNEHVMIDIFYDKVKPSIKRWLSVLNYLIVLGVDIVFVVQGFKYVAVAGKQISQGMEIPMTYMYGIMPVSGIICAVCIVLKILEFITADISYFEPKNVVLTDDRKEGV
ncbi:TRAP transporter small permease [Lachnospiraceae bacterium 47-T17]